MQRGRSASRACCGTLPAALVAHVHGVARGDHRARRGLAALTTLGGDLPGPPLHAAGRGGGRVHVRAGIILAGGCASGTWYRSGEGLVGSWIALAMYALSASAMKTGVLKDFNSGMKQRDTGAHHHPGRLGRVPRLFVIVLAAVTGVYGAPLPQPREEHREARAAERLSRLEEALHAQHPAGALVGLIGVIAWPLSAATGRNDGLGITTPPPTC
ncbi:YeeE/YedE thiosulfate transporter family protein [Kocuria rhizophila]|nr:YeeE/YedE thiosulfate transporter family protein [Kocuria rhizophila]